MNIGMIVPIGSKLDDNGGSVALSVKGECGGRAESKYPSAKGETREPYGGSSENFE
jgi:hypothetical protein